MKRLFVCWTLALSLLCIGMSSSDGATTPYDGTIWNNPGASLPAGVAHNTYHSAIMNVDIGYNIYLPPQYSSNPSQRFPVIYLLTGIDGDENSFVFECAIADSTIRAGQMRPAIVVTVNGGLNSKYMDAAPGSPMFGVYMVESTIIKELIPNIDADYRTVASQQGRAIQGYSMGGGGCLRLSFKYPELFSSVFSMSAAIDDNASNVMAGEPALMAAMFNNDPSLFDQNTSFSIANNNFANIRGLPIHMLIGSNDGLLPYNQAMDTSLTQLSIPHDPLEILAGDDHGLETYGWVENLLFADAHFGSTATPVLTSALTAGGTVGTSFSYTITATNNPTSFNATGLPAGLSVNTSTGVVSGTPSMAGTSSIGLSATNAGGTGTMTLSLTLNSVSVEAPFGGTPWPIPGTVEAENFDNGVEGVAYHDTTPGNTGGAYRNTDVDIRACSDIGGGYQVGWTDVGEWMNYTVSVASSGNYLLNARVAAGVGGGALHVEFDGANITGAINVPNTGSWDTWQTLTQSVNLSAGQHIMRVFVESAGFDLNYVNFAPVISAPAINSAANNSGTVGIAFNYTITASNSPTSFGATGLPAGLSVDTATGIISGTPTAAGTSSVSLSATNAGGTGTATLTLTVIGNTATASVSYVTTDRATQGNWKGIYGADGYAIEADSANYPSYASVAFASQYLYTWNSSTTDVRAPLKASSNTDRIAACWYNNSAYTIDVNLTDGQTHQVALYCLDWDTTARSQTFTISDAGTGIVLDGPRGLTGYNGGAYVVWSIKGHVTITLNCTGGYNAVVSGIFFGSGGTPDTVWVEDAIPVGGAEQSDGGDSWNWIGANPVPYSGSLASQSNISSSEHQHYFTGATLTLPVNAGDTLIAYVYLDPANVPSEIMLQWNDGSWEHRAYWGANSIAWGNDGTVSRHYMGALPAAGQWLRLQVPASQVGLEGSTLNGMAFTLFGGRATWDRAGKGPAQGSDTGFVTGQTLGTLRNDFTGWVGFQFTVGSSPLTLTGLGRWVVAGNSGTHTVVVSRASDGVWMGSVSVSTSGAAAGAFTYVAPGTPISLAANTAYNMISLETSGGDQWYNDDTTVTTTGAATINNSEWYDSSYHAGWGGLHSFGPVSFTYTPSAEAPYGGTPWTVPGTIQAENFDTGGEGVAYHDMEAANLGGQYRTSEGVDIETCADSGGGYSVGWASAGEWLNYTVNVSTTGSYTLSVRVASNGAGGTFHVESDGTNISGAMTIPDTGAWQTWTTLTANVNLSSGQHILRLALDTNGATGAVGNFNWFSFASTGNPPPAIANPPPVIASAATATPNPVAPGTSVSFAVSASDSDGDTLAYTWNFGDGTTGTGAAATHTYASAGNYAVSVTADDGHGGAAASSVNVTVFSAINSGGASVGTFAADQNFSGGNTYTTTSAINTSNVTNPAPQAVYQSERYGNFTYTFSNLLAGASYTVRLHFAEIWWNSAGQRVFNVSINGTQVLSNFDIYATAGGNFIAIVEEFTATASNGQIAITFTTLKDNAKSSGIEIIGAAAARNHGVVALATDAIINNDGAVGSIDLGTAKVGVPFKIKLEAPESGTKAKLNWSVVNVAKLAPGVAARTGFVGGRPRTPGIYTFELRIKGKSTSATNTYTMTVVP